MHPFIHSFIEKMFLKLNAKDIIMVSKMDLVSALEPVFKRIRPSPNNLTDNEKKCQVPHEPTH